MPGKRNDESIARPGGMLRGQACREVDERETMREDKKTDLPGHLETDGHGPRPSTDSGDLAVSGQPHVEGPRYVELIRVSGRSQVERETPESQ